MRSTQELIHWLEVGGGARWLRLAAIVAASAALSFLIAWKQFHGPQTEATLEQADVGRQLARGEGFTTLVNYPQTAALLQRSGQRHDLQHAFPELHQPPLYSLVIAGGLRLMPATMRAGLFQGSVQAADGYGADFFLLGLNLLLLWLAAGLTFLLGRRLFDARVGAVAGCAILVTLPFWQQTLALNGTPLLMVLALLVFLVWHTIEVKLVVFENEPGGAVFSLPARWLFIWVFILGGLCGLVFLTDYSAGALIAVVLSYLGWRMTARLRWIAIGMVLVGFGLVVGPWLIRNTLLTGHPLALAAHDVALKAGDPTAEPASLRATWSTEAPSILLRKLANKTLTSLQENVRTRLWSGGGMWWLAFFVAGWLYSFRSNATNRLRWWFIGSLGVLLVAQAALDSGEAERFVAIWLAPIIIVFGTGFFFVLLGSNERLGVWPRTMAVVMLVVQSLPLVHDAMAPPPGVRFNYPPYFPALIRGLRTELEVREAQTRFATMADIPAGVAWYGGIRCWAQPPKLRDFYTISLEQPIGELLLTPRTLDRPFFSDLNARPVVPGAMRANRFGEWGEIYAGLLTGAMPREFPLRVPHRVADNLYVLLDPSLPPIRGK